MPGTDSQTLAEFAFDHVHHLWSFVDGIAADIGPRGLNSSRSELFSGFLAFDDEERHELPWIDRLAKYAIKAEPSLADRLLSQDIEQAYNRWHEFSEGAAKYRITATVKGVSVSKEVEVESAAIYRLALNLEAKGEKQ